MKHSQNAQAKHQSARLIAALELMEFGVQLMKQNIRRKLPVTAPPEHLDAELRRWLIVQPDHFTVEAVFSPRVR